MGSLEILGNPTGLVRSIGNGVADMFSMPYQGLTRGPGDFLNGVRRGTGSLLWHLSTGCTVNLLLVNVCNKLVVYPFLLGITYMMVFSPPPLPLTHPHT